MNLNYLAMVLASMGVSADEARADSKFTAVLSRQLEHVEAQAYSIQYPELMARQFLAKMEGVDPGAESVVYNEWDKFGMAALISNYADDLPMVGLLAEQFVQRVVGVGVGYQYSIQDLRRAAMSNLPLDASLAQAAREFFERKIDELICFGNGPTGIKGLFNHPNVSIVSAIDPGNAQRWAGGGDASNLKTAQQMRDDLDLCVRTIISQTKGVHQPTDVLMSLDEYTRFAQTPTSQYDQTPILQTWLRSNPYVRAVTPYFKLNTADEAGTGPRFIVYKRNPMVAKVVIPQEWEQLPPQAINLSFKIPTHGRFGGVVMYQPLALVYMDGA